MAVMRADASPFEHVVVDLAGLGAEEVLPVVGAALSRRQPAARSATLVTLFQATSHTDDRLEGLVGGPRLVHDSVRDAVAGPRNGRLLGELDRSSYAYVSPAFHVDPVRNRPPLVEVVDQPLVAAANSWSRLVVGRRALRRSGQETCQVCGRETGQAAEWPCR